MDIENLQTELKNVVRGEVFIDEESLERFSRDGSIFCIKPWAAVEPRDVPDISTLVRWISKKREEDPENVRLSIIPRGNGTGQSGGALGEGIVLHMGKGFGEIIEVGRNFVTVRPGATFGLVNKEVGKRGRCLPVFPDDQMHTTIGGAVSDNVSGEKSLKYGALGLYVRHLKVMLASGGEALMMPFHNSDVDLKQKQLNFEGDVYRSIEILIRDERKLINRTKPRMAFHNAGYNVWGVERKSDDGRIFDLTQLVAGSQGTLGVITEVSLWTLPQPVYTGLLVASFGDFLKFGQGLALLRELLPSELEMLDKSLLEAVKGENPDAVGRLVGEKLPQVTLFCGFEDDDLEVIKKKLEEAKRAVDGVGAVSKNVFEVPEQSRFWQMFREVLTIFRDYQKDSRKLLPLFDGTIVPPERLPEYLSGLCGIMQRNALSFSMRSHAGSGSVHLWPFMDIHDQADRDKIFQITDDVYELALNLGGALADEGGDGLMRTSYLSKFFPAELLRLFRETKIIFDPLDIFNPGKKISIDPEYLKAHVSPAINL